MTSHGDSHLRDASLQGWELNPLFLCAALEQPWGDEAGRDPGAEHSISYLILATAFAVLSCAVVSCSVLYR